MGIVYTNTSLVPLPFALGITKSLVSKIKILAVARKDAD